MQEERERERERGDCLNEWFRVKCNGSREMLSAEEFIDLNLEDVGNSVELVYTPVREDGVKGSSKTILSDVIDPADPVGLELVIPDCCEEKELVPQKRYFGGVEGSREYAWYRTQTKLEGAALMNLCNDHDNVLQRGKRMPFTPSLEDVGAYMALRWEPMRADGKCGKPLVTISVSPVKPALPVVSNVQIKELSLSTYYGEGNILVGTKDRAVLAGIKKQQRRMFLLMGRIPELTKSQILITIAVCCLVIHRFVQIQLSENYNCQDPPRLFFQSYHK